MRVERLELSPYGRFVDRRLVFSPSAALHVVFGRNEAGKTTTLEAISDFLFGFPHRAKYALDRDPQLLRVGGALVFADGSQLEAVRRKGRQNTLIDAANKPVSEDRLRHALASLDRETFEAEFGLSQHALREGGAQLLRAGGKLAETLAAGSALLGGLNAAQKRLTEEKDDIFTPERRSAGKPFYAAVDRYTAAARDMKAAVVESDEWRAAETAFEQARLRGIDLKDQGRALDAAVTRRKRALRVRGKLAALAEATERLAALGPASGVPAAKLAEARQTLAAEAEQRAALERLAAEDAEAARALADISVDESLVAQAKAVETLVRQIGAAENFERDLPHRLAEEDEARLHLDEIARKLGLAGAAELIARNPSDAELARAQALVERFARAEERRLVAEKGRQESEEALASFAANRLDAADPAQLKRRLESFAATLDDAKTLAKERAAAAREAEALAERAAALDPPVADLDALARVALPDEAALVRRAEAERAAEEALRAAEAKLAEAIAAVATREEALGRIEAVGSAATRADWEAARAQRDGALDRLALALDGPAEARAERFETARALALAADATAERLLADAGRAARLQTARDELTKARAEARAREALRAEAGTARGREIDATRALWLTSGIAAGPSARMPSWRRATAELLRGRDRLETRRAELRGLAELVEKARETLAGWLAEAGAAVSPTATFAETHRAGRDRLEELEAEWRMAREGEIARAAAETTLIGHVRALAEVEAAQAELRQEWPAAMARLGLRPEARPEEAKAALDAWAVVGVPRERLRTAADRIEKIRAGLAAFESEAATVVAAATPDLTAQPPLQAAARLAERLAGAQKAAIERDRMTREGAARAARRAGIETVRAARAADLARMREAFGAANEAEWEIALGRAETQADLEKTVAALRSDLLAIGDGFEETHLRAEQAEFDAATLAEEIAEAEEARTRLWDAFKTATEEEAAAQAAIKSLEAGRDAASAARRRAEAAGEVAEAAERWLLRAAAVRLAARAIERHRAEAQDPLIARAGALFALATAQSFAGLSVGYDKADQAILVARRPKGETVEIEGLSEGARDQLFLALRLALLERRAGEPLPFIGDDLLASFDDERARHTLALLAEFGAQRQTILFTHHARVAEIAAGLPGGVIEVIEM